MTTPHLFRICFCTVSLIDRITTSRANYSQGQFVYTRISRFNWRLKKQCKPCHSVKVMQSHHRPGQALRVPGGLRFTDLETIGIWRWWGCQPYAPAAFILPRKYSWYSFLLRVSRPQGQSAAGRVMSVTNSSDTIVNRNRDLPVCNRDSVQGSYSQRRNLKTLCKTYAMFTCD